MNLSKTEREQLTKMTRSRTTGAAYVRRAKLILMLEDGASRDTIMESLGCDSRFIASWLSRFADERLAGMYARHPRRASKHGSTHWSSRRPHPRRPQSRDQL